MNDELQAIIIGGLIPLFIFGACIFILNLPSLVLTIKNYLREHNERDFHLMVDCVYHRSTEEERDKLIKKYVNWSDRRWNRFTNIFGKQTVLDELIPDIEMLRALK